MSRRTGTDPLARLNASCVAGLLISARNASAFLAFFAFVAATKTSTTARNVLSVPGNAVDPKSWFSSAPCGHEFAEGGIVHRLEGAVPGGELLGRLVPGQPARLGVGVFEHRAEVLQCGLARGALRQLRSSPTMSVQPWVPIELSSVFSNSSTVVKRSLPPRHSGTAPEALTFSRSARNAADGVAARRRGDARLLEQLLVEPQDVAAMRARRDPVGLAAAHQRAQDHGVHRRGQTLAVEDRRDAADLAAARVALDRLSGERLPDVRRVTVLQALRELDDRVRAGAARDRAVDSVDTRVRLAERGEEACRAPSPRTPRSTTTRPRGSCVSVVALVGESSPHASPVSASAATAAATAARRPVISHPRRAAQGLRAGLEPDRGRARRRSRSDAL